MSVTLHDDGVALEAIDTSNDRRELFRYVYRPDDVAYESPRPYMHPLRTRSGDVVSAYRPWDHVWHKGLAWSLPHVGPWNFWGGPNYVRERGTYVDLGNNGSVDHERFEPSADGQVIEFLSWRAPSGDVVIRERRTIAVKLPTDDEGSWVLTFRSEMSNVSDGSLDIGSPTTNGRENAGYGGLFWRGPRSFTGGKVLVPSDGGSVTPVEAEHVRGQRAPWLGFVGHHDGAAPASKGGSRASTVFIVDPGSNPGGTPQWFVRSDPFACLCPAPAFSVEIGFAADSTLTFEYAVVVADGEVSGNGAGALVRSGLAALEAR